MGVRNSECELSSAKCEVRQVVKEQKNGGHGENPLRQVEYTVA
jgi:hypothetical protein